MGSIRHVFEDDKLTQLPTGEYNKRRIYRHILEDATQTRGVYPRELAKKTKLTRQDVQIHLKELINEEKVFKQKGRYFPRDWDLSAILLFASFMRQNAVGFIDPYQVTHKPNHWKDLQDIPSQFHKRTTGISISRKYCKTNFMTTEEKYLFEYVNRIGAFITYIFIESMRPRQQDGRRITDNLKKEMSKNLIFNSISVVDLFDRFCLFLNDMQISPKEIPVSLELHKENIDPVELDNATFDKLSEVFRNVYPGIYEGIEKFWFSSRQFWDKIGARAAKVTPCVHIWQKLYIYKYKESYECIKCHTVAGSEIVSTVPEKSKDRARKKKNIENLTSDDLSRISVEDLNQL